MEHVHNIKTLHVRRKEMRNKSTPQEILLWLCLKNSQTGFKFRRQHSIGGYIVDFYCPEKKLAVEIDGLQHLKKENKEYDETRKKYLEGLHVTVLRFSNSEVETNTNKVVEKIKNICEVVLLPS